MLILCEHSRSRCALICQWTALCCLPYFFTWLQVLRNITRVLQVCWFWWRARCVEQREEREAVKQRSGLMAFLKEAILVSEERVCLIFCVRVWRSTSTRWTSSSTRPTSAGGRAVRCVAAASHPRCIVSASGYARPKARSPVACSSSAVLLGTLSLALRSDGHCRWLSGSAAQRQPSIELRPSAVPYKDWPHGSFFRPQVTVTIVLTP